MDGNRRHNQRQNPLLPRKQHKGDQNLYGDKRPPLSDETNSRQTDSDSRPLDFVKHLTKHPDKENVSTAFASQLGTDTWRKVLESAHEKSRWWDHTLEPDQGGFPSIQQFEAGFSEIPKGTNSFRREINNRQGPGDSTEQNKILEQFGPFYQKKPDSIQTPHIPESGINPPVSDANPFRNGISDRVLADQRNNADPFSTVDETKPMGPLDQTGRTPGDEFLERAKKNAEDFRRQSRARDHLREGKWENQENLEKKFNLAYSEVKPTDEEGKRLESVSGYWRENGREDQFFHNRRGWENDEQLQEKFNDRYPEVDKLEARVLEDKLKTLMYRKFGDEIVKSDLLNDLGTSETDTQLTKIRDGKPAVYWNGEKYNVAFDENNVPKDFGERVQVNHEVLQALEKQEQGPIEGRGNWDLPKVFRIEVPGKLGEKPQILIIDDEERAQKLIQEEHLEGKMFDLSDIRKPGNEPNQDFSQHPEHDEIGLSGRHKEMYEHIQRLQEWIQETETTGDARANSSYRNEWKHMLDSGQLDEYTPAIQKWREQQTDSFVVRSEQMEKEVKGEKRKEEDMRKEMNNSMKEYEKEEMRLILEVVKQRAENEQGHYQ